MIELNQAGIKSYNISQLSLMPDIGENAIVNSYQSMAMIGNSLLASVISGGPKLIEMVVLPTPTPELKYDNSRAFPFDKVNVLISNLTTFRDKALYAFCAASGCRVSEALQLLWIDIDMSKQTVKLIDPKSRPHSPSYSILSSLERDSLVWKGRSTNATLLIDPFASIFFESLASYMKSEYIPHGKHDFIFQYSTNGKRGVPYFLCAASSRNGVLKRAINISGVKGVAGPHSLRHMYGTYLLNYFPRPDGTYGLPIGMVQKLMGHKTLKATEKYARYDTDLIEVELCYANRMVFENGEAKSLNQLKKEALLSKLKMVERELA
jgi:integrase/recombinase XerD